MFFFKLSFLYMELEYQNQAVLCAARCFARFIAFNVIGIIHLITDWWFMFMIKLRSKKIQPCSAFACHHNDRYTYIYIIRDWIQISSCFEMLLKLYGTFINVNISMLNDRYKLHVTPESGWFDPDQFAFKTIKIYIWRFTFS